MITDIKYVYYYSTTNKFGFKPMPKASIAGQWELREYDGIYSWHYRPSPGLSHQPNSKWLYWNQPKYPIC